MSEGQGRHERRARRVAGALAGASALPGLTQGAAVRTRVVRLAPGEVSPRVRSRVTSLSAAAAGPRQVLARRRGHGGIAHRLVPVKDDSVGEDRHVLPSHAAGTRLSRRRPAARNLLRGQAPWGTPHPPLTARAEWVTGHPSAVLAAVEGR